MNKMMHTYIISHFVRSKCEMNARLCRKRNEQQVSSGSSGANNNNLREIKCKEGALAKRQTEKLNLRKGST